MIVGLTALIGVIALAWLAFMFGELEAVTSDSYPVTIELNNATGITAGSRVKLSGIDVGYVQSLKFTDATASRVQMTCLINSAFDIPAGSKVTSAGSLLGGASQLAIVPPEPTEGQPPKFLPRDGTGKLTGHVESMSAEFTEIARDLRDQLRPQLKRLGEMSDKISILAEQYTQVGKKLNTMLEQRSLDDVEAGKVGPNVTTIIARTDSRLAELKTTLAKINDIVGDEKLIEDIKATASNARKLTAEGREKIDALTTRYVALADDLSQSLATMNKLLADARTGDGTIGKLMQDPALYNNLTDAATRLTEAIKQAQLLIQKWKAEGLPVQF